MQTKSRINIRETREDMCVIANSQLGGNWCVLFNLTPDNSRGHFINYGSEKRLINTTDLLF